MRKSIKIEDIILDAGTQVRADIRSDVVEDYSESFKAKSKFPPVDVFHDGGKYLLADGFHRVMGASKAGLTSLEAEVHRGTRLDCIKFALSANAHHGVRRTNADKLRSVEIALKEFPKLANRAIAEICAVSHPFVATIRPAQVVTVTTCTSATASESTKVTEPEKRIGLDGKAYKLPVPQPRKPVPQPPKPAAKIPPVPQPKAETKPPPAPKDVLDKTGHPIPPPIVELWYEADKVQELLTANQQHQGCAPEAQDDKNIIFAEVNFSSALSNLDQAYTDIKTAKPYAVCTSCQGVTNDTCTFCKGRGFISQFRFETCAPRELKEIRFKARK
jgi:hypothetical protein